MKKNKKKPYWKHKKLSEMTNTEWEMLCDGCGKCCIHKIKDDKTGKIFLTNVACKLLDLSNCQCTDYMNRLTKVPDCIKLSEKNISNIKWLPNTCAYKLVSQGKDLPHYHHLVCGNPNEIHNQGVSIKGKVISETASKDIEQNIIDWENY